MPPLKALMRLLDQLQRCFKAVQGFYKDSPMIFFIVLGVIVVLILLGLMFNKCFTLVLGGRGAILLDLLCVWLLVRLVVRGLVFPGSLTLVQRNTEATYRVEMARQYLSHLKQLHMFLRHSAKHSVGVPRGLSADGVLRGFAVVECISRSFRMQQQDKVRLSPEQAKMFTLSTSLESWLGDAKIQKRSEGSALALGDNGSGPGESRLMVEWLRELSRGVQSSFGALPPHSPLVGVELVDPGHTALQQLGYVDQLQQMLEDLRCAKSGWWDSTKRFLQVPTVGSLHQLRTELQMRYSSVQCWIPSKRGTLDAMFIHCDPEAAGSAAAEAADVDGEDIPLNSMAGATPAFSGPTLVWCNPNAGYYETMVYQSYILNFYLDRGCNILLFNYSGFGRSRGSPTPTRVAEDGDSVIAFLRGKGITEIGIHGRSIGGIAACHLARRHPDVVKFMVSDRTFGNLGKVAKYTYGAWAEQGLRFSWTWADNLANFMETSCHKVMVCDPKDAMIVDLSALRTAVALKAVSRMAPQERLDIEDERLLKLFEAWRFFIALFTTCEEEDEDDRRGGGATASRPARQPTITTPTVSEKSDVRLKVGDSSPEKEAAPKKGSVSSSNARIDADWVQSHPGVLRSAMGPYIDQLRSTLDVVIEHLDAGGLSLHDVLGELPENPCESLRAWLANLQVWGAIGDPREAADSTNLTATSCQDGVADFEIECFLRKSDVAYNSQKEVSRKRLDELERILDPSAVSNYHRNLARTEVSLVRREFRRRLSALQQAFRHATSAEPLQNSEAESLRIGVLEHLGEVDSFVSTLGRFFKSVDLMLPFSKQGKQPDGVPAEATPLSDSSDEKVSNELRDRDKALIPRPVLDHAAIGHVVHTDCGHNGALDDTEFRLIGLHMRVARFGRSFGEAS